MSLLVSLAYLLTKCLLWGTDFMEHIAIIAVSLSHQIPSMRVPHSSTRCDIANIFVRLFLEKYSQRQSNKFIAAGRTVEPVHNQECLRRAKTS